MVLAGRDSGIKPPLGAGKTKAPPECRRARSRTAQASADSGTLCSTPAFIRDAGIVQTEPLPSISDHRALMRFHGAHGGRHLEGQRQRRRRVGGEHGRDRRRHLAGGHRRMVAAHSARLDEFGADQVERIVRPQAEDHGPVDGFGEPGAQVLGDRGRAVHDRLKRLQRDRRGDFGHRHRQQAGNPGRLERHWASVLAAFFQRGAIAAITASMHSPKVAPPAAVRSRGRAVRGRLGSSPAMTLARLVTARSRAWASDTSGKPPSPMLTACRRG